MRNEDLIGAVRRKFEHLSGVLDERSRRVWAAAEAEALGYGGSALWPRPPGCRERPCVRDSWGKIRDYSGRLWTESVPLEVDARG